MDRGRTPIELDRDLYRSVFGVVTWHALRLVKNHCDSIGNSLKPCTGTFTQSMGLPCAHVCFAKKQLGGLVTDDFDEHWFWDWRDVHQPFREPRQVRTNTRLQNRPQARTGRILSSFETGVLLQRTLLMCSACHQRGHTWTSRHCLTKMLASIAEQGLRLRENELQQAAQSSRMSQTPLRTVARVSPSSVSSFHTAPSISDSFRVLETRNSPENEFSQPNAIREACPETPQRIFRIPSPTRSLGHYVPGTLDSSPVLTPTQSATALALPTTPHQGLLPLAVPASPVHCFDVNCPEMIYERYLRKKAAWLSQHPNVDPEDYRTARGLPICAHDVLRNTVWTMPGPQIYDRARHGIRWTDEEVYAWTDHHQAQEDNLVEVGLAVSYARKQRVNNRELLQIQDILIQAQEAEAIKGMRYLN
jgi:hypothetical protein